MCLVRGVCLVRYTPRTRYTPLDQVPPGPGTPPGPDTPPGPGTPPKDQVYPPHAEHAGRYCQHTNGTHPTGMQSCFVLFTFFCPAGGLFNETNMCPNRHDRFPYRQSVSLATGCALARLEKNKQKYTEFIRLYNDTQ